MLAIIRDKSGLNSLRRGLRPGRAAAPGKGSFTLWAPGRRRYRRQRLTVSLVAALLARYVHAFNGIAKAIAMKLYDGGRAPNPRRVRIFLAEKGIEIPAEQVDLNALQQRSDAYTAINPLQRVPALVLDDGTVIAESIAICRYFEGLHPEPPLFGRGALENALVEMWNRRAELHLLLPVSSVFQHLHPAMKQMVAPQVPAWGEANKPLVMAFLRFLDGELKNRPYVAGQDYSVADITAMVAVDFLRVSKLTVPDSLENLKRWHAAVAARPSAAA
jgi:glutathione S-transferase